MRPPRSERHPPSGERRRPSGWRPGRRPCGCRPGWHTTVRGVDGSVFRRYQHPARLASPRGNGDDCSEVGIGDHHLRTRLEGGLLSRQVGGEVLTKPRWVKIIETVRRLLYRIRLAEVTWKALSVPSLTLSGIRHVCRNIHQACNRWVRARFGNYRSSVAVGHKNASPVLLSKDAFRSANIVLKRC
jgi:hypothetical protein